MCTRKSVKFFVLVTFVLVAAQYLFNVLMVARRPAYLDGWWGLYQNGSVAGLQRTVAANVSRQTSTAAPRLELCPIIPPTLKGHVTVNTQIPSWAYLEEATPGLAPGGHFRPRECVARSRVAVIIPFRDREIHLKIFLQNIHPFLQRQQLEYGIYVVEITSDVKFNRALLMNVGFAEAMKEYDYQCFIFHDVDLLPEDDRNLYTCPQLPRHMSVAIDRLQYKLPYVQIFGGVSAISTDHFRKINGFSNLYFGWGGEDDDIYKRILYSNLTVIRYSPKVARYKMLVHKKDPGNPQRHRLLRDMRRRHLADGLTSLNYTLVQKELKPLYTWILIRVSEKDVLKQFVIPVKPQVPGPGKKPPPPPAVFPNMVANLAQGRGQLAGKAIPPPPKPVLKKPPPPGPPKRRTSPVVIDWVPKDFNGSVPDYLNNYDFAEKQQIMVAARLSMDRAKAANANKKKGPVANMVRTVNRQPVNKMIRNLRIPPPPNMRKPPPPVIHVPSQNDIQAKAVNIVTRLEQAVQSAKALAETSIVGEEAVAKKTANAIAHG